MTTTQINFNLYKNQKVIILNKVIKINKFFRILRMIKPEKSLQNKFLYTEKNHKKIFII